MRLFGFKEKQAEAPAPAPEVTAVPVETEAPAVPAPAVETLAVPGVPGKYIFEADKGLLEKPAEPKYVFTAPARVSIWAKDEKTAAELAEKELARAYAGTGTVLGKPVLVASFVSPTDWSYGYGDDIKSGPTGAIGDLVGQSVIR